MNVVLDIEANSLINPTQIWLIVCKDIDTSEFHIFRNLTSDIKEKERFIEFARQIKLYIGHNILGYDWPIIRRLLDYNVDDIASITVDTLVVSKLVDYARPKKHSIEAYGEEFSLEKIKFSDWTKWSQEMEDYCIRDVNICHKVYLKYLKIIKDKEWQSSILLEHKFQLIVNSLNTNGFSFNTKKAEVLLSNITGELVILDKDILESFPPREILIREFIPKATKFGTISKTSVPRSLWDNILDYEVGKTYRHTKWEPFNPSSHKQIIDVLTEARWSPIDKTKTHILIDREINRLKRLKSRHTELDLKLESCYTSLKKLGKYGWKINENNLSTLPEDAPSPARSLAKRILLEARRRTLTEWLGIVSPDTGRIHGNFYGIGAWTHRMAHQHPNTANIPTDAKLFGTEMRALWQAPRNRLLVGVDAEGIQLRIFAHYIDDAEFTNSLVNGRKEDKSDPHNLNKRILGDVCKDRQTAKRFIYALLLGAGIGKLAEILEASSNETTSALERLLERYQGFAYLKKTIIPGDGKRGWFLGLDGRHVSIPGETSSERSHLCMSGYLQNGEAIVMKKACLLWHDLLKEERLWKFVNFVHDEWQTEVPNNMEIALRIAKTQADSLRIVGEELKLKCPLAGSYWNDDRKDYTIGTNWSVTH